MDFAADLDGALAHRRRADAVDRARAAPAVVLDDQLQRVRVRGEPYARPRRLGVLDDVGQRLLGDAQQGDLGGRGGFGVAEVDDELDRQPGRPHPLGLGGERGGQAAGVEDGGAQVVGDPADLADRRPGLLLEVHEQLGLAGDPVRVEHEQLGGQQRADAVVQVAAQPAPLVLPRARRGRPRRPQRLRLRPRAKHEHHERQHLGEHAPVVAVEPVGAARRPEHERPDRRAVAVHHGLAMRLAGRSPCSHTSSPSRSYTAA